MFLLINALHSNNCRKGHVIPLISSTSAFHALTGQSVHCDSEIFGEHKGTRGLWLQVCHHDLG